MKKSICSLLVLVVLILTSVMSVIAFGANTDINEQVEALLDLKSKYTMEGNLDGVSKVEAQLASLGVEKLTTQEVAEKFGNGEYETLVTDPADTALLEWYSTRLKVTRSGTTYEIQSLYVQPLDTGSAIMHRNTVAQHRAPGLTAGALEVLKIVGNDAAASANPIVSVLFTFYDMFKAMETSMTTTTVVQDVDNSYMYTVMQYVCFQYVKVDGQADSTQELCHISSKASGRVSVTAGYTLKINGVSTPGQSSFDSSVYTIRPANYANTIVAVDAYRGSYTARTDLGQIRITGLNGALVAVVTPICPAFPAHVL